jgi:hypothetical protein
MMDASLHDRCGVINGPGSAEIRLPLFPPKADLDRRWHHVPALAYFSILNEA